MADHNELGKKGESIAFQYLRNKGYDIVRKNARYKKAEVDILAFHNNQLVVVEVKARTNEYYGRPEDFITKQKISLLADAANDYIEETDCQLEVRFDVISILFKEGEEYELEHIEDAFYPYM